MSDRRQPASLDSCEPDPHRPYSKRFRCRRYRTPHDPHYWVGKATDVEFFCDGGQEDA